MATLRQLCNFWACQECPKITSYDQKLAICPKIMGIQPPPTPAYMHTWNFFFFSANTVNVGLFFLCCCILALQNSLWYIYISQCPSVHLIFPRTCYSCQFFLYQQQWAALLIACSQGVFRLSHKHLLSTVPRDLGVRYKLICVTIPFIKFTYFSYIQSIS